MYDISFRKNMLENVYIYKVPVALELNINSIDPYMLISMCEVGLYPINPYTAEMTVSVLITV